MEKGVPPVSGVLFDNKTEFYLRWSQEQERWIENFATRILEAFEKECTFVEELLKKNVELKRKMDMLSQEVPEVDYHMDRDIEYGIIQEMGTPQYFTEAARNVIRNRMTQISFSCTVLPDFMIPVDAMAEFHWHASYNTHLLSDSPKGGCFGMECEVVLGTDTFAYFKTGHQRFCNEVRRKVVDALQARFDPNHWSFQPKFFLRNIIDETNGVGGGDIGFNCAIDMRLLQVPEDLSGANGRQRGYVPRGEIRAAARPNQAFWGGGGGGAGAGIPHRQRLIPRDDNDVNQAIFEFGTRVNNNLYGNE